MNPGVLSMLVAAMLMVLLATGWKKELMDRIPISVIVLFVCGWFLLHPYSWQWNGVTVNGSYVLVLGTALIAWGLIGNGFDRLHVLSVAFLLAAIYVFFVQLYRTSPVLVVYSMTVDLAVLLSVTVVIFCRQSFEQWTALSMGLWLGDALLSHVWGAEGLTRLGTEGLYDMWWLSFALARLFSVVAHRCYAQWQILRSRSVE